MGYNRKRQDQVEGTRRGIYPIMNKKCGIERKIERGWFAIAWLFPSVIRDVFGLYCIECIGHVHDIHETGLLFSEAFSIIVLMT